MTKEAHTYEECKRGDRPKHSGPNPHCGWSGRGKIEHIN